MKNRMKLVEGLGVLVLALGLTELVLMVKSRPIAQYADLILAGIWLYLPLIFILARKESLKHFAISNLNFWLSLKWLSLVSIIVFPAFYALCAIGALKIFHYRFELTLPKNILSLMIGQLLLVSLPEEWFFRGYLQGRLNQFWSKSWKFLGAEIGPGLLLSALLFALAHFSIRQTPDRFLVFFPALVFGWLREKTNSLLAPVLFHFISNLTFIIFQMSLVK